MEVVVYHIKHLRKFLEENPQAVPDVPVALKNLEESVDSRGYVTAGNITRFLGLANNKRFGELVFTQPYLALRP